MTGIFTSALYIFFNILSLKKVLCSLFFLFSNYAEKLQLQPKMKEIQRLFSLSTSTRSVRLYRDCSTTANIRLQPFAPFVAWSMTLLCNNAKSFFWYFLIICNQQDVSVYFLLYIYNFRKLLQIPKLLIKVPTCFYLTDLFLIKTEFCQYRRKKLLAVSWYFLERYISNLNISVSNNWRYGFTELENARKRIY